ncbi:MAG: hypothetical protein WBA43_04825 [Elainellaceae cyanobacterium]|nr:hypothetical protein [Leptolyngbya sp. CCY15150]
MSFILYNLGDRHGFQRSPREFMADSGKIEERDRWPNHPTRG